MPGDLNRYTSYRLPAAASEPLPLAFAIQDGAGYAGAILKTELADAGITYSGTLPRQTLVNDPGTVLATTQSAPLHDLLRIMLKKSDNMIADTVFRTYRPRANGRTGNLARRLPTRYGKSCASRRVLTSVTRLSPMAQACPGTTRSRRQR